jgi:hypothetical protein
MYRGIALPAAAKRGYAYSLRDVLVRQTNMDVIEVAIEATTKSGRAAVDAALGRPWLGRIPRIGKIVLLGADV